MMRANIRVKSAKLKRCPFCGSSDVKLIEHRQELLIEDPFFSIDCCDCGADIYFYGAETREAETIAKYDRRPANGTGNNGSGKSEDAETEKEAILRKVSAAYLDY